MTTHRSTRWQVLIPLDFSTTEIIVANIASVVEFCNKSLVKAHSVLRVYLQGMRQYIYIYQLYCFKVKLEVIKWWLKKTAGLSETTKVEFDLLQSKFF